MGLSLTNFHNWSAKKECGRLIIHTNRFLRNLKERNNSIDESIIKLVFGLFKQEGNISTVLNHHSSVELIERILVYISTEYKHFILLQFNTVINITDTTDETVVAKNTNQIRFFDQISWFYQIELKE